MNTEVGDRRVTGGLSDAAGHWVLAARPKTLAAAVVPVAVGTALAVRYDAWQALPAVLCLGFALLIQIGTNFANDYYDFIKGADTPDRIGPTRVVAAGLVSPTAMLRAIFWVFVAAFLVGLNLVFFGGWWLVLVGAASILFGILYTGGPFPLAYRGMGDLFVLVFFGWVAVIFTFYVQAGYFTADAWIAGVAVGALAVNILVVNNARDLETDARANKRTLVVRFGRKFAGAEYAAGLALAMAAPVALWMRGYGFAVLLPVLVLPFGARLCWQLLVAETGADSGAVLGKTGGLLLIYGLLFSAGVIFA